jgi:hypothetical protein
MVYRLRAFAQTTTRLRRAVMASVCCGAFVVTHEEHDRPYEESVQPGSNLARAFEQSIFRFIWGTAGVPLR